jgi:hypothetical protein
MYARSSTFRGRPGSLDAGIGFVRDEVLPAMLAMDGCVGLSMLANRDTGLCITTSAWHSLETRKDSEQQVSELRERIGDNVGGAPEVDQWEIALLHRDHWSQEGACVRATWVRSDPAEIDRLVDFTKTTTLPMLDEVVGFCSASVMIDRGSGKGVVAVSFDTALAEENSRATARGLREKFVNETRGQILDVQQFDLALAHLHAPELV